MDSILLLNNVKDIIISTIMKIFSQMKALEVINLVILISPMLINPMVINQTLIHPVKMSP